MTRGGAPAARRVLRPVPAVLVGLLTLLLAMPGVAAAATAPGPRQTPDAGAVVVTTDAMSPRVVTSDGPPAVLVTGRLRNAGATPVRDVGVRLQRGEVLADDRAAGRALDGAVSESDDTDAPPPFTPAAGELDPGDTVPFAVQVPLGGAGSLGLAGPGVYPVVVEVNGTPGTAVAPERVAAERLLLPVTGLPGGPAAAVPAPGLAPMVSVLYPIADRPRRLPVPPGAPTLLSDDDLATSLAPGGRLAGLVDALPRGAPLGSPAAASVCLAVDADLLETASDMAAGYLVVTPTGSRPGAGQAAAGAWLEEVRAVARGRCVLALPYANADLLATSGGNMSDLTSAARTLGARRTADLLGVTPVPGTTAPAGGLLDERSLADLAGGGAQALVVDGSTLAAGSDCR